MYREMVQTCGVKLLYFVLRRWEERNVRCINEVDKLLKNISSLILDNSYNLHVVCSILHARLLDYQNAGRSLNDIYFILKRAFLDLKISSFTDKIFMWEYGNCGTSDLQQRPATVFLFLREIPEMMERCIDYKSWPEDKRPLIEQRNSWYWCEKCGKMNGHSTQEHKQRPSKTRKFQDGSG